MQQQTHIVIGNLPDDVTEEGIREALSSFAQADKIRLANESGTPTALIDVEMSRAQAESLAQRINGRSYEGRVLRAWVPKMDW
ncbi:RNA-binding protein [Variovorax sp. J22R24]|uniref:RNA recognition motif domain-containing protein n=1 Tax=Variovorax gracilis TaxID=3053502 RepID=UPI002576E544|nr:RNA-binding protein [Variovorax sp. J22R24]MDM0106977.1 RNA-binding protein [Variovorax sp. J22R24]